MQNEGDIARQPQQFAVDTVDEIRDVLLSRLLGHQLSRVGRFARLALGTQTTARDDAQVTGVDSTFGRDLLDEELVQVGFVLLLLLGSVGGLEGDDLQLLSECGISREVVVDVALPLAGLGRRHLFFGQQEGRGGGTTLELLAHPPLAFEVHRGGGDHHLDHAGPVGRDGAAVLDAVDQLVGLERTPNARSAVELAVAVARRGELTTGEAKEDLLVGRSWRERSESPIVQQGLDRSRVDQFDPHDLAAEVVAGVQDHRVVGEETPQGLGQPFGESPVHLGVRVLPELGRLGQLATELLAADFDGLGVVDTG